jgi:hypothetical protein
MGDVHFELPRREQSDRCEPLVGFVSGNFLVHVVMSCGPAGHFLAYVDLFC